MRKGIEQKIEGVHMDKIPEYIKNKVNKISDIY